MTEMNRVMVTGTMVGLLLFVGACMGAEDPIDGASSSLATCPAWVVEGLECRADLSLECVRPDLAGVCHCEAGADDPAGSGGTATVVCSDAPPPPGGGICTEHVRTGDFCDPLGPEECTHACDPALSCRCTSVGDASDPGCEHVWVCDEGRPPPGTDPTCSEADLRACTAGEDRECINEDGRVCRCYATPDGDIAFECDTIRPDPSLPFCDEDALRACFVSGYGECVNEVGTVCRCVSTPDGGVSVECDGITPPPGTVPSCDEDTARICSAAGFSECAAADGRLCRCSASADGSFSFECDGGSTPPPSPPACTDESLRACFIEGSGECVSDEGLLCRCSASADGSVRFECDGVSSLPGGPEPRPSTETCTDEHVRSCSEGREISCSFDGLECFCDPSSTTFGITCR